MFLKSFPLFLIIFLMSLSGCKLVPLQQHTPKDFGTEIEEVITSIKNDSKFLKLKETCPSEWIPSIEKKIFYSEQECEDSPKDCLERCKNNDGNACYALALVIQTKVAFDNEESSSLFSQSCKLGIISGCTNRAAFKLDLNSSEQKDAKCVADTFEKTCAMNDAWGCSMYGTILAYGHGREKNFENAANYLQKACEIDVDTEGEACQGAKSITEQIEQSQKENQKNDSNTNSKKGTR